MWTTLATRASWAAVEVGDGLADVADGEIDGSETGLLPEPLQPLTASAAASANTAPARRAATNTGKG